MLAELRVAKELGITLGQLERDMTHGELWIWVAYFTLINEAEEAEMKKGKMRR